MTTSEWFGVSMEKLTRDELVGVIAYQAREIEALKVETERMRDHVDWTAYLSTQSQTSEFYGSKAL